MLKLHVSFEKKTEFASTGVKVQLLGAQGTRRFGTTNRIDRRVREKKTIQLSAPQPGASNNPLFSGWACKPYLYIESDFVLVGAKYITSGP